MSQRANSRRITLLALTCLGLLAPALPASAQTAVTLDAGTLGVGGDVGHAFSERLDDRLGIGGWTVSSRRTLAGIDYEARGELRAARLFADWHPRGRRLPADRRRPL